MSLTDADCRRAAWLLLHPFESTHAGESEYYAAKLEAAAAERDALAKDKAQVEKLRAQLQSWVTCSLDCVACRNNAIALLATIP